MKTVSGASNATPPERCAKIGRVFKRDKEVGWRCRNCGYLHSGKEAVDECPACAHPQAHFELLGENW